MTMNKDLEKVIKTDSSNGELTQGQINTLVSCSIIPKGTPLDQIKVFASICKEQGLSPFSKEIYLTAFKGKYTPIISINGVRKIATNSGCHAGTDAAKFNLKSDGSYKTLCDLLEENKKPITATVSVYKFMNGVKCEFSHTVSFAEFNGGGKKYENKWDTMPYQMISKVAEMHALKKAFNISGAVIIDEEVNAYNDEQKTSIRNIEFKKGLPVLKESMISWLEKNLNTTSEKEITNRIYQKYSLTQDQINRLDNLDINWKHIKAANDGIKN